MYLLRYFKFYIIFNYVLKDWKNMLLIIFTPAKFEFTFERSNGLEVMVLDSQSRGAQFQTTGWFQCQLSLAL